MQSIWLLFDAVVKYTVSFTAVEVTGLVFLCFGPGNIV
jgi:hypothetical protein